MSSTMRKASRQRKIELAAAYQADLIDVTHGGFHLSSAGHHPWIAIIDGILGQRPRLAPQREQARVAWQEEVEHVYKFMSFWHHESVFLQKGLEVFFRCLLAKEAHDVPRRRVIAREFVGHFPVLFGFVNPL